MATMRQIRTRIKVAGNIAQITRAMKMVAAARLKRAQDRVIAARPFVERMTDVVADLTRAMPDAQAHPLTEERPVRTTGVVIISADRGLCGSYNSGIIRRTVELLDEVSNRELRLMAIGRKGAAFFARRGHKLDDIPQVSAGAAAYHEASALADCLRERFESGVLDEVLVVYTRFASVISQHPVVERVLPIQPPVASEADTASTRCIFEPDAATLVGSLLPRYLTTRVYYALLESAASEHGARMTAMSAATDNASKMISALTLSLNRARQAAITKEISEIVSGAEALKS